MDCLIESGHAGGVFLAMVISKHVSGSVSFLSVDGQVIDPSFTLSELLSMEEADMRGTLHEAVRSSRGPAPEEGVAPVDSTHEIWASGVTYLRSRVEREAESNVADVYARVYEADRPEIFFKSTGARAVGHGEQIRIRRDSTWNVPEPELVLVINSAGQIVGYTAGNDVSSRSIEGENPLYLPQAKTYDGACAIGPSIVLCSAAELAGLNIELTISRAGSVVFEGSANTDQMKRTFEDLAAYLTRELTFDHGTFLFTGTGIVPTQEFTLLPRDVVKITVGALTLVNEVADHR